MPEYNQQLIPAKRAAEKEKALQLDIVAHRCAHSFIVAEDLASISDPTTSVFPRMLNPVRA
jgi:hypothetical protein